MKSHSTSIKRTTCRYCDSTRLKKFLSLGKHPPSNSFIHKDQIHNEQRYPLEAYVCQNCWLVQLVDVVSPKFIFDNYLYLSSSSKALKKHYADLAKILTRRFSLKTNDVVVDIGCNDGILLHGFTLPGLIRVGVEPSQVAKIAEDSGLEVVRAFFTKKSARQIVKKHGKAKIVTATNVFAHVDMIDKFVACISILLADRGVFIIEAPYLIDMIDQTIFDTIYHEHLCYLSLTPVVPFLTRFGLEVFDVQRVPFGASGPAIRIFVAKTGQHPIKTSVLKLLESEKKWGVKNTRRYDGFARKIRRVKADTIALIKKIRSSDARLGGYGAPAKGNTLLNFFGLSSKNIECIADTNPLKQGLLTPGSHIPIVSEKEFIKKMPEYALLLSWNYLDFFLKNSAYIRKGGKFLVPIPIPQIIP